MMAGMTESQGLIAIVMGIIIALIICIAIATKSKGGGCAAIIILIIMAIIAYLKISGSILE